jgi:hypothetical protein
LCTWHPSKGYITYKRFFKLAKAIADDPDLEKVPRYSAIVDATTT